MGIYKRKNSDKYWYRFRIAGRDVRGSTGQSSHREAEKAYREIRTQYEARAPKSPARGKVTLTQLAGLHVEEVAAAGASKGHVNDLINMWQTVCKYFGDCDPKKITRTSVIQYINARRDKGARGQTIVREKRIIQRALTIAHERGFALRPPEDLPAVRRDAKGAKAGKAHAPEILRKWIEELKDEARDEAIVVLTTGLRFRELKRMSADWIKNIDGHFYVVPPQEATKSKEERVIPLTNTTHEIITKRNEITAGDKVFSAENHKRSFLFAAKRIGYDKTITYLDLRHCFRTASGRVDIEATRATAGHSELSTTMLYQHSTLERQRDATEKAVCDIFSDQSGHSKWAHHAYNASNGAKDRNRTDDLLITNQTMEILHHLNTCNYCQLVVAQHIKNHQKTPQVGTASGHTYTDVQGAK